ncbi:MAG: hypothetical protein N2512_13195 [Armatimonadetes bacterium]|nr:hypothetical protein [Armatimonadota bacterium]
MIALFSLIASLSLTAPDRMDYLGWFAGTVEIRRDPLPGYYYDPEGFVPLYAYRYLRPVRVKVQDGGTLCPSLTRYKTYLYSPVRLPGQYMLPDAGRRMYPSLQTGWPFRRLPSIGAWPDW